MNILFLKKSSVDLNPSTHTTLFWHPYDVDLTLWTLYGRQNDVVCLLGSHWDHRDGFHYFLAWICLKCKRGLNINIPAIVHIGCYCDFTAMNSMLILSFGKQKRRLVMSSYSPQLQYQMYDWNSFSIFSFQVPASWSQLYDDI